MEILNFVASSHHYNSQNSSSSIECHVCNTRQYRLPTQMSE